MAPPDPNVMRQQLLEWGVPNAESLKKRELSAIYAGLLVEREKQEKLDALLSSEQQAREKKEKEEALERDEAAVEEYVRTNPYINTDLHMYPEDVLSVIIAMLPLTSLMSVANTATWLRQEVNSFGSWELIAKMTHSVQVSCATRFGVPSNVSSFKTLVSYTMKHDPAPAAPWYCQHSLTPYYDFRAHVVEGIRAAWDSNLREFRDMCDGFTLPYKLIDLCDRMEERGVNVLENCNINATMQHYRQAREVVHKYVATREAMARCSEQLKLLHANRWLSLSHTCGVGNEEDEDFAAALAGGREVRWLPRVLLGRWAAIKANAAAGMLCTATEMAESFPFEQTSGKFRKRYGLPETDKAMEAFLSEIRCASLTRDSSVETDVTLCHHEVTSWKDRDVTNPLETSYANRFQSRWYQCRRSRLARKAQRRHERRLLATGM